MKKLVLFLILFPTLVFAGSLYVPSRLSELSDDSTHRVVTDTEKNTWNAKPPVTTHLSVTLASTYGCASGWQAGSLASEIASLVAVGINADYIFCVDVSGLNTGGTVSPTGTSITTALGGPTISGQRHETISPTGLYTTAFVGIASVSAGGNATITPTGLYTTASLGTATLSGQRNQTLTPTGMYATASLGTANVSGGGGGGLASFTDNFTGTNGDALNSTYWDAASITGSGTGSINIQSNKARLYVTSPGSGSEIASETSKLLTFSAGKTVLINAAPTNAASNRTTNTMKAHIISGANSFYIRPYNYNDGETVWYYFALYDSTNTLKIDCRTPAADSTGDTFIDWKIKFNTSTQVEFFLGTTSCGTWNLPFAMADFTIKLEITSATGESSPFSLDIDTASYQ